MLYGKTLAGDKVVHPGFTKTELHEFVKALDESSVENGSDFYDMTGDLAVGPKIVADLLNHIEQLEAQLAAQNS